MQKVVIALFLTLLSLVSYAQDIGSWEEYLNRMGQMEDIESGSWEQTIEELQSIAANKMDLNRCTREDLNRLPFLSNQQIMDIMEYRDKVGLIESPIELRMISSLERTDVDMLMQFVTIVPEVARDSLPSLRNILKYGQHEMVGAIKIPFYERKGDRNGYLGYKYKHWLRYTFHAGQHVKAGFVASQDAGEPFFAGQNAIGYDFYSAYALLSNVGRFRKLVVGRYRLRFGMGLVMNNSFGLGKINTLATIGRNTNRIMAHSSRLEANYLQGVAATVTLSRGLDMSAFVSWRRVDATLNADSISVASLLTTGYHRTPSEMRRRRNTSQTTIGGNLNFFRNGFHVGITALRTAFNRDLRPNTSQRFRRWYPSGKSFWNMSVDYGYVSGRLNIAGETATGNRGAIATINSISYQLLNNLSLTALQRFYPYQYEAIFGESFAEGRAVNNESGLYIGGNWMPMRHLLMTFYTDMAYFAWPKYQASRSSRSFDHFVQATYEHGSLSFLGRYRLKAREHDNTEKTSLLMCYEHRGRLAVTHTGPHWTARTQADMSYTRFKDSSFGYMLTENVSLNQQWLKLNAQVGYFHTDDFRSRIYVYERGMLYTLSFPAFFGQGMRVALSARTNIGQSVMVMAKLGTTHHFDVTKMGSGLQTVEGKNITDLEVQIRVKL